MSTTWDIIVVKTLEFLPALAAAMVILVVSLWAAAWLARIVRNLLERRNTDRELVVLLGNLTRWGTIGLGVTMALQQVGFNVTAFLAGLGALGFAAGFAVQDVSKNFVAGVLLLLQQPFNLGEAIEVNGFSGTVEEISLRATAIRTFDGRLVYIPNADVYTSAIVNFSRAKARRVEITVGVAYGTDLDKAKRVALETVQAVEGAKEDPAPNVVFHTFNDASVDMTIYFWIDLAITDPFRAKDAAVQAIHNAFAREGIDIPYPIQTVLLHKQD